MAPDFPKSLAAILLGLLAVAGAEAQSLPALGLSTDLGQVSFPAGAPRNFSVALTNFREAPLPVRLAVEGDAAALAGPPLQLTLASGERREVVLLLGSARPGTYLGTLVAEGGGERREVPFEARVVATLAGPPMALEVGPARVRPGEMFWVNVTPRASSSLRGVLLVRTEAGDPLFNEPLDVSGPRNFSFTVPSGTPPGDLIVEAAVPRVGSVSRSLTVVPSPFPTYLLLLPSAAVAGAVLFRWRQELAALVAGRRRYPPLSAYGALPPGPLLLGRVAGTRRRFGLGPEHLQGHILVAGATGGGKSVAAMVVAEEALRQKWAVAVCDPTAQWTGLLRPCRDRALLHRYRSFGLGEPGGWPGARRSVPEVEPRDLAPGRLLLFDFPENFEENLARLLDRFRDLRAGSVPLLVVLEEVHRALPKYGPPSQLYPLLESVVREFRQRGVALVMTSHLLSDFSPEIRDNVLAEFQMHTKGPEDLESLEKKYGRETARLATRLEPGAGLLHHPGINGGRPVAVEFRPTLGDPHKLPGPLLERWRDLWSRYRKLAARSPGPEAAQALARARERLETLRLEMALVYLDEAEGKSEKA